jgi:hypothetical protein
MTRALFVAETANRKTGPLPVVYAARETCPASCAHYRTSCYAEGGPARLAWNRAGDALDWRELCERVAALPDGELWRYAIAGDLPGRGGRVNRRELRQLVRANRGRRGFTYSHKRGAAALAAIRDANAAGFTVNLSADDAGEADELAATGAGPVVVVVPEDAPERSTTPAGRPIVVCPAQTRDGVTCASCQLCQRVDRAVIVGFRAHGARARTADERARRIIPLTLVRS